MATKNKKTVQNEIKREERMMINNGLTEALFGNSGVPGSSQLSQVDTLFKNSRWYLISNMRQILSEIYVEHGIVQTIVDVPVDDAFRGGIIIQTDQLDEQQIKKLQDTIEREDDMGTIAQANKWKRLFGGSAVIIITDQDPKTPLDLSKIKDDSPLEFRAVDLWELYSDMNTGDYTNATSVKASEKFFNYYNQKIHHSRVIKMKGMKAPSFIRPRLRGWGFSVVESLVRSINQYLKATDLSFEVLDEHKLDIFKIKGLTQALAVKGGAEKIHQRITLANQQKNYQNALAMDAEDDYLQKELAFGGLSEVMAGIRMQVASDLRMPLTKVFGISAAGFSSGEDDIENYNAMIESTVRTSSKFDIVRLVEIRCQKLFGMIPDDLTIDYHPLRVLSSEQEENVKTQKFSRLLQARQAGEMDSREFKEACNKENLLGVKLDTSRDTLPPTRGAGETEGDEGASAPASSINAPDAMKAKNSLGYEVAVYDQVGRGTVGKWRKRQYDNNDATNKELWKKSKQDSVEKFGKEDWEFIIWHYERQGGEF